MPSVVTEALGLMFNMMPIKSVDFYASMPSAWWGVSIQIAGTGGLGQLFGAFSFVLQEAGFPSCEFAASPLPCRAAPCFLCLCASHALKDVCFKPGPTFSARVLQLPLSSHASPLLESCLATACPSRSVSTRPCF